MTNEQREKNRLRAAAYRAAHPEKARAQVKAAYAKYGDDYRAKRQAYNAAHKEEIAAAKRAAYVPRPRPTPQTREEKLAKKRAYRLANLDAVLAGNKAYRLANREKVLAQTAAWKLANRDKWYEGAKRWARKNPEAVTGFAANRRALVKGVFVEQVDRLVVFHRDHGKCGICCKPVDQESRWEIDHVIPVSKGGAHSYANVQLAHRTCNRKKSGSLPQNEVQVA